MNDLEFVEELMLLLIYVGGFSAGLVVMAVAADLIESHMKRKAEKRGKR